MMLTFVLIAGSLAAAAAVLLLLPLMRRRTDSRPAAGLAAGGVLCALLLGGAGLYAAFSNYAWVGSQAAVDSPAAMAARLAQRLGDQPGDLDGWLMLGRTYATLEQYPLASRAYQRADRIANGQNVEAIIGIAEALLAQDFEQIRSGAGHLIERALALEPNNSKALLYGAFAAMSRGETASARERFTRMLTLNPPDEIRHIIEKQLLALDGGQPREAVAEQGSTAEQGKSAEQGTAAAMVAVHITLAPALASKVPGGALLFVAARDPQAPGPPFAAKRLPATFPVDVELSAADAMLPSRRIAAGQKLEIVARVALGGTPTATSGDPFGQVSYHVGKDGRLNIVIDRLAP
jgi:cytochrome c-type biogenesis protein CcmH